MGRILALDMGLKRIGMAITDEEQIIAQPMPYTVEPGQLEDVLRELLNDYEIEKIILGLPKTMGGKQTKYTKEIERIGREISAKFNVTTEYMDERLTTKQALGLGHTGVPVDSLAAQKILQDYLQKFKMLKI